MLATSQTQSKLCPTVTNYRQSVITAFREVQDNLAATLELQGAIKATIRRCASVSGFIR
jgi:outer membrane protein TolC